MGAVRITSKFPQAEDAARKGAAAAVVECALRISRDIKDSVEEHHLIDTSTYYNSWTYDRESETSAVAVSKGAPYGAYLEYGHRVMRGGKQVGFVPARPHVRPVADAWRGKVEHQFNLALAAYIARATK